MNQEYPPNPPGVPGGRGWVRALLITAGRRLALTATSDTATSADGTLNARLKAPGNGCRQCGGWRGGWHYQRRPGLCPRCDRVADWREAETGVSEVVNPEHRPTIASLCSSIGVEPLFICGGKAPSFDDSGLFERLTDQRLPQGGLYVCGPVGSHKSHLLAARAVDAARRGYTARFANWADVLLRIRGSYGQSGYPDGEAHVVKELAGLDYLGIDDLSLARLGRRETSFSQRVCYAVLDRRYRRGTGCTTDITSNLLLDELNRAFDERIVRRIREMCTVYTMLLEEPT